MGHHASGPEPADVDLRDAGVRRRLVAEGPVGEWETLPGTHTALMRDVIRFAPDGTGETRGGGVLLGETVRRFGWSVVRPGLLACVVFDAASGHDVDDAANPDEAQLVGFEFVAQESDVGTFWVMRDPNWDGFWEFALPVVPRGRRRG